MAASGSWGIEVGAYALKAVRLERSEEEGGVRVAEYVVLPHPRPLSDPDAVSDDVLRVTVGAFANQADLTRDRVAISVPGHESFVRFPKLPPVEVPASKIPGIVRFEAQQQIPFPIDEVEWDYQTFRNESTPEIEVGIFAVTKARVQRQLDLWADVGVRPSVVNLSPVAVYNALAYDLQFTEQTPGTIIVDVGTTATDLIIAEAGRVWVRTFQIGGHQFTDALVNAFKLSYSKAEKLKREAEQSRHARHAFQAMRPVFTELAQEIQRSIGYYKSLHKDANLTRLIGLGSTFQLPGLRKYLKQQLQLDVYRIERFKRVSVEGVGSGEFEAASVNLSTAYGLALQGLGYETIRANLMPIAEIKKAVWKGKVGWFAAAAGVAVAASGAMFIRPIMDQMAVDAAGRPPVIDTTLREFQRLQTEASGATGELRIDPTAANAVALAQDSGTFERVLGKLGDMLSFADARAATITDADGGRLEFRGPAFELVSLESDFLGPGVIDAPVAAAGGGGRDDFYGGRGGGGGGGFDDFDQGDAGEDDPTIDLPRLVLTLRLQTEHPLAQSEFTQEDFLEATVGAWLAANAQRAGEPLYIVHDPDTPMSVLWTPGAAAGAPGAGAPGGAPDRDRGPGRGGRGLPGEDRGPTPPVGVGSGAGEGDERAAATLTQLQNLAPIVRPEGSARAGAGASYEITLTVVLRPLETGESEGDE
ncbi:MAG: type IV pilus assembly protein PilM [Phycisphaerales bacterium]|nr:MAG: type IV pilus assembly protein PilM [Phycisphaerales bacterium]